MNKISLKDAKCTGLKLGSAIEFKASDDSKSLTGFDIEAYTGTPVERWWGKLVIDISGINAKQKMPIFRDHNHSQIVGYSTGFFRDGKFKVSGVFSKQTAAAKEVMALAQENFPWQASIGVVPELVVEVKEGFAIDVNGQTVSGPAEIWSRSTVKEVSFVPLGADHNTSVAVFSDVNEVAELPVTTPKPKRLTMEDLVSFKKDRPDLVTAIVNEVTKDLDEKLAEAKAEGAKNERERTADIRSQLIAGHESLIEALVADGISTGADAAKIMVKAMQAEKAETLANFRADAPPVVPPVSNDAGMAENLPLEQRAKREWEYDKELQAEFMGDFELYVAYLKEDPAVKIKTLNNRGE